MITQALLTGNFESAVDLCLHDNRMADAIILAIAGGQELLLRTQKKYFAKMQSKITRVCNFPQKIKTISVCIDFQQTPETVNVLVTYDFPCSLLYICF